MVLGGDPITVSLFVLGETPIIELEEQLLARDAMLKIHKETFLKAQTRVKRQADAY